MRILFACNFLFIIHLCFGQKTHYYIPGQANKFIDTASTLLLTPKTALIFASRDIQDFNLVKKVEVKSIKEAGLLASVLGRINLLSSIELLEFNNCNLLSADADFHSLQHLLAFTISNTELYNPNDIIYALRNNSLLKTLCFSTDENLSLPDSIHLLSNIQSLIIRSNKPTADAHKKITTSITYTTLAGAHMLSVEQYGFPESLFIEADKSDVNSFAFSNSHIKPPFKSKINDTVFYAHSLLDNEFEYASGSTLFIPKNAFETQNGTPYKETVRVFYREFRNPVDILLSGIPMYNSDVNDSGLFMSAGMYELWAYGNQDQKLRLKKDKRISVDFKPTTDTGQYNFFTLDTASGKWNNLKKPINLSAKPKPTQKDYPGISNFIRFRNIELRRVPDHTPYEERLGSLNYLHLSNKKNYYFNKDSSKYSLYANWKKRRSYGQNKIKYKTTGDDGSIIFEFKGDINEVSLAGLENNTLRYAGNLNASQFRKKYRKLVSQGATLKDMGSYLELTIKTNRSVVTLPFNVIKYYDEKTKKYVINEKYERNLSRMYKTRVKIQARIANRKHERLLNSTDYDYVKGFDRDTANRVAYKKNRRYLSPFEKQIDYNRFLVMADSLQNIQFRNFGQQLKFNTNLDTIMLKANSVLINSNLGFNNLDQYIHNNEVKEVYAQYNSSGGEALATEYVNTLVPGINTSIANYNIGLSDLRIKIRYIKNKPFTLMRLDKEGFMQIDKNISATKENETFIFPVTSGVNIKGKSSREISKLLGL